MTRRQAAELVAVVACYLALRECFGRASEQLHWSWSGPVFFAMWFVACVVAARAWGWPRFVPRQDRFRSRTTWLVLVIVVIGTEYLYGFKLCRAVLGELDYHAPVHVAVAFNAIVAAPLVEELVFRGLLYDAVRTRSNVATAIGLTSILFATSHWGSLFEPAWTGTGGTPLWMHALFGALMALLRWRTGAIGPGIALHAVYNGLWAVTG